MNVFDGEDGAGVENEYADDWMYVHSRCRRRDDTELHFLKVFMESVGRDWAPVRLRDELHRPSSGKARIADQLVRALVATFLIVDNILRTLSVESRPVVAPTSGWTDGRTDGRTDDRRSEGRKDQRRSSAANGHAGTERVHPHWRERVM